MLLQSFSSTFHINVKYNSSYLFFKTNLFLKKLENALFINQQELHTYAILIEYRIINFYNVVINHYWNRNFD